MPIDITMPALSPTMETGTLAKWIVKVGDSVKSGDILCEIETDKATMEVESIDEGVVAELLVAEGAEEIPVGQVIARLSGEGEVVAPAVAAPTPHPAQPSAESPSPARGEGSVAAPSAPSPLAGEGDSAIAERGEGLRVNASPLARRLAQAQGIDLAAVRGSGPNGRVVKADLAGASTVSSVAAPSPRSAGAESPSPARGEGQGVASAKAPAFVDTGIPHEAVKLSNMRKTIARRLAESKATIPHIYLTVDIRLDALLKLRGELNAALEPRGIKLSVNDMLIKALAAALIEVPACNVSFAGDTLIKYSRADISVAVSVPTGLITPIIADASNKALSAISTEMKALADKA